MSARFADCHHEQRQRAVRRTAHIVHSILSEPVLFLPSSHTNTSSFSSYLSYLSCLSYCPSIFSRSFQHYDETRPRMGDNVRTDLRRRSHWSYSVSIPRPDFSQEYCSGEGHRDLSVPTGIQSGRVGDAIIARSRTV